MCWLCCVACCVARYSLGMGGSFDQKKFDFCEKVAWKSVENCGKTIWKNKRLNVLLFNTLWVKMAVYVLRVDPDLYRRIAKRAKELDCTKAEVFRRGVKRELGLPNPGDHLDLIFNTLREISNAVLKVDRSMKAAVDVLAEDIARNRIEIEGLSKHAKKSV